MTVLGTAPARRTALLAAGVVVALTLAGCGSHQTGGAAPTPATSSPSRAAGSASGRFQPTAADFRAVRRVLAARAHAVIRHDRHAFLATVDPTDASLLAQQRTLFGNLSALDVSALRYALEDSALVPAHVTGHDPVLHPPITEFLRLRGTLLRPVTNPVDETFVERGGRWVVGAESAGSGSGALAAPQWRPWAGVPIAARRTGPMTVLVDRSRASTLGLLSTAVHDGIRFDASVLGVPPSYRIAVDATSNGGSTTFSSLSKEEAAAVTFGVVEGTRDDPSRARALAGTVIKINPHDAASYAANQGLLRHELTHYLLHRYNGVVPKWLSEGVATWIQYYPDDFAGLSVPPALYDRLVHADRVLPSIGLFNDNPDVNYPVSQAAVAWLVARGGTPRLLALMRAYRSGYQGANADALTPRLLRRVYGVTPAQVVSGAFSLLASLQH